MDAWTPRDSEIKREACAFGLVTCTPIKSGCDGFGEEANPAAGWVELVKRARADKAARVSEHSPQQVSLAAQARQSGIVPHPSSYLPLELDLRCRDAMARNQRAAALIRWGRRHGRPGYAGAGWARTAWDIARER